MKKFIYSVFVLGTFAGLTSCSSEDPGIRDNDGRVAFTVSLPAMNTRSPYGDTPICDQLTVTVYDADGEVVIPDSLISNVFGEGVTKQPLTLQLVKNHTYRAVFYANNSGSQFATYKNGEIEVNYAELTPNSEIDDAFFRSYEFTVDGTSKDIKLYRPFAQVNIGTDDLESKAAQHIISTLKTTLKITDGLYTKMNLKDSTVDLSSAVTAPTSFVNPEEAKVNEDFPVEGYSNLLSVYLLVPDKRDLINAECNITSEDVTINSIALGSTHVQLNYRTNIYGTLITSQQPVNVIIEPAFGFPDIEREVIPSTPEELGEAFKNPTVRDINIESDIDASSLDPSFLEFDSPKTINIADDATLSLPTNAPIVTSSDLVISGGTLVNRSPGSSETRNKTRANADDVVIDGSTFVGDTVPNSDGSIILIKMQGGNLTIENSTLINAPDYRWHGKTSNTAAIQYQGTCNINIKNSKIYSGLYCICGMKKDTGESVINIENTYIESFSSSSDNGTNWSYATRLSGKKATLTDCTVVGIQGGFSTVFTTNAAGEEVLIDVTIDGGLYYTHSEPGKTPFYPVYITGGTVTINSGYFYGAATHSTLSQGTNCVVCGDNDTGQPVGNVVINGGYFSGMAYNTETKTVYDPDNYKIVDKEYEGFTFKYEFVK